MEPAVSYLSNLSASYRAKSFLKCGSHSQNTLRSSNKISEENNGQNGKVVVAAGISDYSPSTDSSISSVFERADSNMYIRKKQLKDMLK